MNILYIGSSGALSLIPFKRLRDLVCNHTDYNIVAVGINRPMVFNEKIIALENESLSLAASQASIPIIDLSQSIAEIIEQCKILSVDLILMSCYSRRLPDDLISIANHGCFNMHPSLLPAYRGPEPIFWQMKQGSNLGVSWHRVNSEFDAGDIAIQKNIIIDDALTHAEISMQLAQSGADSMEELLSHINTGAVQFTSQDRKLVSYFDYPQLSDFEIDTTRDAQQIYNFMCATHDFGVAYRYQYNNSISYLIRALDYDNNQSLEAPEVQLDRIHIPCNSGVLIATYTDKIPS